MIRTLLVALFMVVYLLLVGLPMVLWTWAFRTDESLYWVGVFGCRAVLRMAGVRVRVEGRENIPPGTCVFVANHTSNADPPAAIAALPRRVSLLAKKEVFRVPILAQAMLAVGIIPVDRGYHDAAVASVERAIELLKKGRSFLVYAEGTRSKDGRLRPFKAGTFIMAIRAEASIVPVSIANAHRVMIRGDWRIHPGLIEVRFGVPVDTKEFSLQTKAALIARAHAAVAAGLPPDQRPPSR